MKAKIGFFLMAAVILGAFSATGQTVGDRPVRPGRKEIVIKKNFRKDVDRKPFFTEEQKEAMKAIRLETAKEVKPLRNELGELTARQKTLTTAPEADLDVIYGNIEKISEVKIKMAKIRARQQQEIRALLTDEQLLLFDSKRVREKMRHPEHMRRDRRDFRAGSKPAPRG